MNRKDAMQVRIDYQAIDQLFARAHDEKRGFLYEYEVYDLLSSSGSETSPACSVLMVIPR